MPTTFVISIIAVSLIVLVGLAVVMQTIDRNKKEQRRRESSINTRVRNFEHILESLPDGLLNTQLKTLLNTALVEQFSQLCAIAPKNAQYSKRLKQTQHQLQQLKEQQAKEPKVKIADQQQAKDVRQMLTSLYNYLPKLSGSGRISVDEAKQYGKQIRRLNVKTIVDVAQDPLNRAVDMGKHGSAINLLKSMNAEMDKENDDGFYNEAISNNQSRIAEFEQLIQQQAKETDKARSEAAAEWDKSGDEPWKKKAIYD